MKKKHVIIAAFFALFGLSGAVYAVSASKSEVIATVNGVEITKAEITPVLQGFTGKEDAQLENYPVDFQKEFVNKYVEKKLITEAARNAKVHEDKEIVAKIKEAEDFLIEQKFLKDLFEKQRSDEKLREIYDEAFKDKAGQDEAKASHILVENEAEAKELKKKIDGGADFAKLAGEKSKDPGSKINGGDLGYFTADKMVPEFSKAAFALKKGEVSAPVKSDFGWHVIKLTDKRKVQPPSFEQAKKSLETELARRIIDAEVKKLRETAKIEITYDFVEAKKDASKEEPKKK